MKPNCQRDYVSHLHILLSYTFYVVLENHSIQNIPWVGEGINFFGCYVCYYLHKHDIQV